MPEPGCVSLLIRLRQQRHGESRAWIKEPFAQRNRLGTKVDYGSGTTTTAAAVAVATTVVVVVVVVVAVAVVSSGYLNSTHSVVQLEISNLNGSSGSISKGENVVDEYREE